jgi:hypothetical protein
MLGYGDYHNRRQEKRRCFLAVRNLICVMLLLALASCAGVSRYPIDLSYQPKAHEATREKGAVTVVLFNDKRDVAEKKVIGMKDGETRFVSFGEGPASAVSDAVRAYLQSRGYTVNKVYEAWDGTAQSLRPEWGDLAVGGDIEDLNITVTSAFPKTEYRCSVKLRVITADPKTKTILQKEKIESSSSYVTVYFSRDKAEELINSTLADALEKTLDKIGKYVPKQ